MIESVIKIDKKKLQSIPSPSLIEVKPQYFRKKEVCDWYLRNSYGSRIFCAPESGLGFFTAALHRHLNE